MYPDLELLDGTRPPDDAIASAFPPRPPPLVAISSWIDFFGEIQRGSFSSHKQKLSMQSATTLARCGRSGRLCRSILSRVRGRRAALVAFVTIATTSSSRASTTTNAQRNDDGDMSKVRRREDGVVIQHDPYAPGMMEQYGMPGATDDEGFDPYKDTVGPGIYGGIVKRDVVSSLQGRGGA